MSTIVKEVAGWVQGLILLFGVYVLISGSTLPGGAFPAGVIIAFSFILVILSHGREFGLRRFKHRHATILICIGVLIFLLTALSSLFVSGTFFKNLASPEYYPHGSPLSGSFIFACEIGIALLVSMSLLLVFSIMAGLHADSDQQ